MPRDGEPARLRLMQAALELFGECGFEGTTTAQIAERAGVTERTFFRHFPDKKEVLFQGQAILSTALSKAIADAPAGLSPLGILRTAFSGVTDMLEQNRSISEPRRHIIAATPALQEREIAKHAALVRDLAAALHARSIPLSRANLASQIGLAVLGHALAAWFADSGIRLADRLDQAFWEYRTLSTSTEN